MSGQIAVESDSLIGQRVGPGTGYQITKLIGAGGMGRAYLAERDGIPYVLKQVLRDYGDDVRNEQALKLEADTLSKLRHRLLPSVKNYFGANSQSWLVLEFIEGKTLEDYVLEKSATKDWNKLAEPLREVANWVLQLSQVLSFLHGLQPIGIIHRDIKPENILRRPNGSLVLIDFGLARRHDGSVDPQERRLGTPGYAAPEYMQDFIPTPLYDIFSVGVLLHFCLSGVDPRPKDSKQPMQSLSALPRRGEPLWDGLVECSEKARHSDPEQRFQSVAMLEAAIKDLLSDPADGLEDTEPCAECHKPMRAKAGYCSHCGEIVPTLDEGSAQVAVTLPDKHQEAIERVLNTVTAGRATTWPRFQIAQGLRELQQDPGFGELISLQYLPRVTRYPHQIQAAKTALGQMRGYCLLADEVGLGKTIEAGLILKELMLRGRAKRILIFATNDGMCRQWQQELLEKFEVFVPVFGHDVDTALAWRCDRLLVQYRIVEDREQSLALNRRLEQQSYDLVIFDEAHHLIAPQRKRGLRLQELAKSLGAKTRHMLMLSATPLHNDLKELHTLLTLLKPGSLGDFEQFAEEHQANAFQPKKPAELRAKLKSVMIRNERRQIRELSFPVRDAQHYGIQIPARHRGVFDRFKQFVRLKLWKTAGGAAEASADINIDFRAAVQELVESFYSSNAAFQKHCEDFVAEYGGVFTTPADRSIPDELLEFKRHMPEDLLTCKVEKVCEILERLAGHGKFLIFTQYPETAEFLDRELRGRGLDVVLYPTEDLNDGGRHLVDVLGQFKSRAQAMICSENASEGLNLQEIARLMINFDLPWDPMKIEQRIGRIQRLKGFPKIYIYNLYLEDTIEKDILKVLDKKLHLFELTIGRVEEIVGNLADERFLENQILDFFTSAAPETEARVAFSRTLGTEFDKASEVKSRVDDYLTFLREQSAGEPDPQPTSPVEESAHLADLTGNFDQEEIILCRHCQAELEPDARFCSACLQPISDEFSPDGEVATVCRHCQAELEPDARFCSACLQPISDEFSPEGEEAIQPDADDAREAAPGAEIPADLCPYCESLLPDGTEEQCFCAACNRLVPRSSAKRDVLRINHEAEFENTETDWRTMTRDSSSRCPRCQAPIRPTDSRCSECEEPLTERNSP